MTVYFSPMIFYFQARSYTFSQDRTNQDRLLWQDHLLEMIVCLFYHLTFFKYSLIHERRNLKSNFSFNEAREACQAKGGQWDLVVFESDEELEYVKKLINCLPEAFWVGYRENNGVAIDILNKVKIL